MVLVGDFFQLPPVSRGMSEVEFAFEHPIWREARLIPCVLTTQYRQNNGELIMDNGKLSNQSKKKDALLEILSEIRSGRVTHESLEILESRNIPVETEDHTELFTRNISVDAYNKQKLDNIGGDIFVFEMHSKGSLPLIEALKK